MRNCGNLATVRYRSGELPVNANHRNRQRPSAQADDRRPVTDDWPKEANAAATFFQAALFLIHEGWNRLEDLGSVEEFGSDSQRTILNLDHLAASSIRAASARVRRD